MKWILILALVYLVAAVPTPHDRSSKVMGGFAGRKKGLPISELESEPFQELNINQLKLGKTLQIDDKIDETPFAIDSDDMDESAKEALNKYSRNRMIRATQRLPTGNEFNQDALVGAMIRNQPSGAQLVGVLPRNIMPEFESVYSPSQSLLPMRFRLPDNYTLIRPNVVDNFRCGDLKYGYYADVENECQLFHVCMNFASIWPQNFTNPTTWQFSFICPKYTRFSQDVLTCAWEKEAVPCHLAPQLYRINDEFFKIPPEKSLIG